MDPEYFAVIVSEPAGSWLPLTVKAAVALEPAAVRVTVPRVVAPTVKVTVPVGAVVPLAGFTMAVRTVVELAVERLVELADREVVVLTGVGAVTVTVAVALEALNALVPA